MNELIVNQNQRSNILIPPFIAPTCVVQVHVFRPHLPALIPSLHPSVAVVRRAVITLVSALLGVTPPPARGGGHP